MSFKLPEKRVIVKANIKPTPFIPNTNHVASFLMPNGKNRFVVPELRNGTLSNPLTKEEKEFFESHEAGMSFNQDDLSIYKKKDNFWESYEVYLGKTDRILNLNNPKDYLDYKVLLSNKELVASSEEELNKRNTYLYYLIDEDAAVIKGSEAADKEERAWELFGELKSSRTKMLNFLKVVGLSAAPNSTDDFLKKNIMDFMKSKDQKNKGINKFIEILEDPLYEEKVFIQDAIRTGALDRKGSSYFMQGGDRIGVTLADAINYLKNPENQEVYMIIQQRIENAK